MKKLKKDKETLVIRRNYGAQGTNGTITYAGAEICHTIELAWRNNLQRLSCISEGRYRLAKQQFYKHGEQIGIPHVLGREAILIHTANDAMGCIAPVTKLTGEGRGDESRKALEKLKALVYSLWDMVDCVAERPLSQQPDDERKEGGDEITY